MTLRRHFLLVIDRHVEDMEQDEKSCPDLLESIMKASGLVKEEFRQSLCKMHQFRTKIPNIRVCTFEVSGQIPTLANVASEAIILAPFRPELIPPDPNEQGARVPRLMRKSC